MCRKCRRRHARFLRCVSQTVARACRLVNNGGHARRNAGDIALGIAAAVDVKTPPWLVVVFTPSAARR
jgi:hypothetical protein